MPAIRGLTVAVGEWYARTLEICLVKNMRHLTECYVATSPADDAVKAVVAKVPGARVFETNAFFEHGARFNKGLAVELLFELMGRYGWFAVWDADCLWPDSLPFEQLRPDRLHGARRRVLENPDDWRPGLDWGKLPLHRDGGPIGFLQIFHADAPGLRNVRPWYDVSFAHAGGCDAAFMGHFPGRCKVLPVEVLHLGPPDVNWMGTDPAGRDLMAKYVYQNNWASAMKRHSAEAAARAGELPGRVTVPGYPVSDFQLPFERRAQRDRKA